MLLFYVLVALQIIAESLPISSSGHTDLLICFFNKYNFITSLNTTFFKSRFFTYFLTLPSLCVITIFFVRQQWISLKLWRRIFCMIIYATAACIITTPCYLLGKKYIAFFVPLFVGFGITGLLLASLYWCALGDPRKKFGIVQSLGFGFVQGCAFVPGVSRFGLMYVSLRWAGYDAQNSFQFAWWLQIPLLAGAFLASFIHAEGSFLLLDVYLVATIIFSSCISYFCLWRMYVLAIRNRLGVLSWYMIIPVIFSLYCLCGV